MLRHVRDAWHTLEDVLDMQLEVGKYSKHLSIYLLKSYSSRLESGGGGRST